MRIFAALGLLLLLAGCAAPPADFSGAGPAFDPVAFFTGHVTSLGVEENRSGQPSAIVRTDCEGTATGPNSIRMVQVLHIGNAKAVTRIWRLTRTGQDRYTATANDMAGDTVGSANGPEFHWRWVLKTHARDPLLNVTLSQWMYRMPGGEVMIRTVVTKLGFTVAEVSEVFRKAGTNQASAGALP
ncbi:MAG TPA: DUF3833 family protein [Acidocella sp.]|nr:DUF3833 family protein [Acidocella sp.]